MTNEEKIAELEEQVEVLTLKLASLQAWTLEISQAVRALMSDQS